MTAAIIQRSVRILRQSSLLAESFAWAAHLQGLHVLAAHYDREADRLWARSEQVAAADAVETAVEARPC